MRRRPLCVVRAVDNHFRKPQINTDECGEIYNTPQKLGA